MRKTWMSLTGWMLALTVWVSPTFAYVVVGYEGEPFYFKNGSQGLNGACYEIIRELCHRQNVSCKFKVAQIPKIMEMMKNGEADISCPLAESVERQKFIHFSERLFKTRYAFFAKNDDAKKIKSLEDLAGYSVSVFAPSVTSQTLINLNKSVGNIFNVIEENTEMISLQKAEKVGNSLSYINADIAHRWLQKSRSPLEELKVGHEEIYYHIGFSKRTISSEDLNKLRRVLADLQSEKQIETVSRKYELHVPETETAKNRTPKNENTFP